jgi:hypothetical protein
MFLSAWGTLGISALRVAFGLSLAAHCAFAEDVSSNTFLHATERQVTRGPGGRILTNTGVWSPDGQWIAYDTRSDAAGEMFDGTRIEAVNVRSGEVRVLFEAANGAHCGVATWHPREPQVVFILGPEHPTPDWTYCAFHRQGVIVEMTPSVGATTGAPRKLDARDLTPPFTPGALRGGSHVHVWDAAGDWVSFTYEDHLLAQFVSPGSDHDVNQRNVGVSVPGRPVRVVRDHPRNRDGEFFTVLVTRTTASPRPGSDEIQRACEEGWIGTNGYVRADGSRQCRALAFQGEVLATAGQPIAEVFVADLPEDLSQAGDGPLAGTGKRAPTPPRGVTQRRLTFTSERRFPGLQGPRHWLRSSPDGTRIALLMKDDAGAVQLWTVSPNGGPPAQLTHNAQSVASAFTWSPDGRWLSHVMDGSVCLTDSRIGQTHRLTPRSVEGTAPRPQACVFAPDGQRLAFVRRVPSRTEPANQICVVEFE